MHLCCVYGTAGKLSMFPPPLHPLHHVGQLSACYVHIGCDAITSAASALPTPFHTLLPLHIIIYALVRRDYVLYIRFDVGMNGGLKTKYFSFDNKNNFDYY